VCVVYVVGVCLCVWLNGANKEWKGKSSVWHAGNEILYLALFFFVVVSVAHCIDGTKIGQ